MIQAYSATHRPNLMASTTVIDSKVHIPAGHLWFGPAALGSASWLCFARPDRWTGLQAVGWVQMCLLWRASQHGGQDMFLYGGSPEWRSSGRPCRSLETSACAMSVHMPVAKASHSGPFCYSWLTSPVFLGWITSASHSASLNFSLVAHSRNTPYPLPFYNWNRFQWRQIILIFCVSIGLHMSSSWKD